MIKKSEVKDLPQLIFSIKGHFLLSHPNLAQLYACFCDENSIYLLMELCGDGNLSKYRKKIKNDEDRDRIVVGIAKGIQYMHKFCLRHGDLKL
jgi:serine/threonine protein kinase